MIQNHPEMTPEQDMKRIPLSFESAAYPMADLNCSQIQDQYAQFLDGLTRLTRRHGVAVKSVGGVRIAINPLEFRNVVYVGDICSGDLLPCEVAGRSKNRGAGGRHGRA